MTAVLESLAVFSRGISRFALWFSATGLALMTVVIGWQVWGRYVLNDSPQWTERFSLLLMLYYIMLAAAVGVRERFHLGLVFVVHALPPRPRRVAEIAAHLVVGAFGGFMAWYGSSIAVATWSHTIPTLGLPTGSSYLPFPIAGVLIVLFSLEHILNALTGSEVKSTWN